MHNLMKRCPKYPFNKVDEKQQNLCFKSEEDGQKNSGSVIWKFDQTLCRQYCARMFIMDEVPFRVVEHEGFRDFCNMMHPKFQVPFRFNITKDCMEIYLEEKDKLFKYFKSFNQRVSLTTDIWTSRQNLSYLCLTVHFVDDEWKLHKRILNFTPIPSYSGDVIGKCIENTCLSGE
ncbi:hypothetical protein F3Y22_tig00111095pilonHSYRG00653 [Hibiscus syriacus]|uniref:Uncharacterized protein n=1 Tax=Hibiscus syriacus TaxID=106335 RepID=A0A6A2Z2Q2_HIBSY|nr:hypothetical protein F3Y22_tig00111095pilonHSYRG00653 [Hibiscus syriacus]